MKILPPFKSRRSECGSAVMLVMTMLGVMAICVAVNTVALRTLSRELKLLEKKQTQRLQTPSPAAKAATHNRPSPTQHD